MPWLSTVPAVVMAWYSGERGGEALAQLLFGQANFGGKMNVAWPRESDLPPFKSTGTTTVMDYYLGYRYFDKNNITPIFPLGRGSATARSPIRTCRCRAATSPTAASST